MYFATGGYGTPEPDVVATKEISVELTSEPYLQFDVYSHGLDTILTIGYKVSGEVNAGEYHIEYGNAFNEGEWMYPTSGKYRYNVQANYFPDKNWTHIQLDLYEEFATAMAVYDPSQDPSSYVDSTQIIFIKLANTRTQSRYDDINQASAGRIIKTCFDNIILSSGPQEEKGTNGNVGCSDDNTIQTTYPSSSTTSGQPNTTEDVQIDINQLPVSMSLIGPAFLVILIGRRQLKTVEN